LFSDVEYSIAVTKVPKTLSYQQAVSNCQANGKELCSSKAICKDGKPYLGVIPGDHWVPVADSPNEWMQIGKQSVSAECEENGYMPIIWINVSFCHFCVYTFRKSSSFMYFSQQFGIQTCLGFEK
jgi:hypothetical protein